MFLKLKLKNRLLLGYAAPVAMFIGLAAIVYSTTNELIFAFQEVKRVQNAIIFIDRMAVSGMGLVQATRGYIIKPDEIFLQEYQTELKRFRDSAEVAKTFINDAEQKKRYERMIALSNQYDQLSLRFVRLLQQGKRTEALAIFSAGTGRELVREFTELNQVFNEQEKEILEKQTQSAYNHLQFLLTSVIVGAVFLVVLALTVALLISSNLEGTIQQAINTIASSSTQIVAAVEEQERTINHQATAVHQTTSTMDELSASSQNSAERAESTRAQVEQIAGQILHLSEQISQIESIANLVSELSNQTNMLALNAAVEAVRAGDHGKGFGVVATEIRKLADQSKRSAEKINALVSQIRHATNSAVVLTEHGTKSVENIVSAINNIAMNAQQISLSAQQQAIATQQVVEAMNNLNFSTQQTVEGINQTKVGLRQLNEVAVKLKHEV